MAGPGGAAEGEELGSAAEGEELGAEEEGGVGVGRGGDEGEGEGEVVRETRGGEGRRGSREKMLKEGEEG